MPFLVVDTRFGTPIHVFLAVDPAGTADFPDLPVREVELGALVPGVPCGLNGGVVGRHTDRPDVFREFASEGAVAAARYHLIEPRYVGFTWATYVSGFLPSGSRKGRHPPPARRSHPTAG